MSGPYVSKYSDAIAVKECPHSEVAKGFFVTLMANLVVASTPAQAESQGAVNAHPKEKHFKRPTHES